MSDEESFVILGSTPTPSMDLYSVSSLNPSVTPPTDDIIQKINSIVVKPIQDESIDVLASNLRNVTINSTYDDDNTPTASLNPDQAISLSAKTTSNINATSTNDIVDSSKSPQLTEETTPTPAPPPSSMNTSISSPSPPIPPPRSMVKSLITATNTTTESIQSSTSPPPPSIMNEQPFSILNNLTENDISTMNAREQREGSQENSLKNNIELAEQKLLTLTNSDWTKISNNFCNSSLSSPSSTSATGSSMLKKSFAEKIVMGSITRNDLHAKIAEEFPSLCSKTVINEDLNKLQLLICEHIHLKGNLEKTNIAMRQHFTMISKWQQNVKLYKQAKQEEIASYLDTIDKFKQENAELIQESIQDKSIIQNYSAHFQNMKEYEEQKLAEINQYISLVAKLKNEANKAEIELTKRNEQFDLNLESAKFENDQLIKTVSEKESIIGNLRSTIEKYEKNRVSFEFVPKNENSMVVKEKELVPLAAHEAITRELKRQISILKAEKLEIKDMEQVYIDELNCLKVNLTKTEELLEQAQASYAELNAEFGGARGGGDDDNDNDLNIKLAENKSLLEQEIRTRDAKIEELNILIGVLNSQLDIYKSDFDMERQRCEDFASEREDLLADIQLLQRRNKQLMEETGKKSSSPCPAPATKSPEKSTGKKFCPFCSKNFPDVKTLEAHVYNFCDNPENTLF